MSHPLPIHAMRRYAAAFFVLLLALGFPLAAVAHPQILYGQWYQAPSADWNYDGRGALGAQRLQRVEGVSRTGGRVFFEAEFLVSERGRYVLDFKNTSIIGRFRHYLVDDGNHLVANAEGGIESGEASNFFLRHGREFDLVPGRYRLVTELSSPFYLAQPEPYLDNLSHYRAAMRWGNALALVGLGVFLGLGIYYAALALARRRVAEGMYAAFILGNILFNGSALLVFSDLFGLTWVYLVSVPILFSNAAYVVFVAALLEIRRGTHPRLYRGAMVALVMMAAFILVSALRPNWSLELARYGVGVFLTYGLVAGLTRARQGNVSARLYLVAIGVFFALGLLAITQTQLAGVYTIYIEHVGMFAVAVEVVLLALVLAYQFGQVHKEKDSAIKRLEYTDRIARTDVLTGLANRFSLDAELASLPRQGSLTYIDMDQLKYYNDHFGHAKGDQLLQCFGRELGTLLREGAKLFRVGGDEFAITCPTGDIACVESMVDAAIGRVRAAGFEFAGASVGSARVAECSTFAELKHAADTRMYQNKREKKQGRLA